MYPPPKLYTFKVSNLFEQYRRAEEHMQEQHKRLLSEGWQFDEHLGQYTHPDKNDLILIG